MLKVKKKKKPNCTASLANKHRDGITAGLDFRGTNCLFLSRRAFKSKTKTQQGGINIFIKLE